VDDGSTDGTAELVREHFPSAKYCFQENRGVSAARNRGIGLATGSWIALLDSDDEWRPEKLERQSAELAANPDYGLCHCDEVWMRSGRRVNAGSRHVKAGGHIFRRCLPLCAISPSAAMIRRRVFDEIGGFDESLPACEDYDFWLRYCARYPVLYVDEKLVIKHGGRRDQLSQAVEGLDRFRIRALEKILSAGALGAPDSRAARRMLIQKIRIYAAGAAKRGRDQEADALLARAQVHCEVLAQAKEGRA